MIPKVQASGKSFKGLAAYLSHDPKAATKDRVAWVHTINLAHDDALSAVDEMMLTARHAELLKQEAGMRAGGRATENPVKHFSLNWSPEDKPTREHMIEATEDFLAHMGWQERQALLVAHNDKDYAHVHVMLNAVHPETGRKLDESFEQKRAQKWALAYEREHGIRCEQRLINAEAREDAPTRPAWLAFEQKQQEFECAEKDRRAQEPIVLRDADILENPENPADAEWKILKQAQRNERQAYFAEGKLLFSELRSSVYREVREEFREKWAGYFEARDAGGADETELRKIKKELVAGQAKTLESRRDAACGQLLESRKEEYRELLDGQREERAALRWRQEAGLDNSLFLQAREDRRFEAVQDAFREAAGEATPPMPQPPGPSTARDIDEKSNHRIAGLKSETAIGTSVGISFGLGLVDILGGIADGLVWSKPDPRPAAVHDNKPRQADLFEAVIDDARKRQRREQEDADREWRLKQRGNDGI